MTTIAQRTITTNPRRVNYGKLIELAAQPGDNGTTLERVNVNDIERPDYQRDIRPAKLRNLINGWNPNFAGWIIVSRRANGSMFVIDGQHRTEAVRKLQGKIGPYIEAIVVRDWSSTQEAEFFAETQSPNNRASLNPEDIHHAALLAGNARALDLQDVVTRNGFRIGNRDGGAESGRLKPVRAINEAYDRYGEGVLSDLLTVIREAWGVHASPESCVITGMALFFGMYPNVRPGEIAGRIGKLPYDEWLRLAKVHARSEKMPVGEGVAYRMRGDYNHNRKESFRLPDFGDTLRAHRAAIRSQAGRDNFLKYGPSGIAKEHIDRKAGQ